MNIFGECSVTSIASRYKSAGNEELELDASTYEVIKGLCSAGDTLVRKGLYEEAIAEYNKAWKLVPAPKE